MNLRQLANTTYQIPIGTTVRRALVVQAGRCEALRFNTRTPDGTYLGADSVNVTRVDASTWLVETQPYPDNEAYCNATGQKYKIAVRFTVVSSTPLP
jgi:hypothetical protein